MASPYRTPLGGVTIEGVTTFGADTDVASLSFRNRYRPHYRTCPFGPVPPLLMSLLLAALPPTTSLLTALSTVASLPMPQPLMAPPLDGIATDLGYAGGATDTVTTDGATNLSDAGRLGGAALLERRRGAQLVVGATRPLHFSHVLCATRNQRRERGRVRFEPGPVLKGI